MAHSFKQLLAGREIVRIWASGRLVHPVVFDVYGKVGGFHGLWLDQEHCGLSYEQVVLGCACARAHGWDTFVRMALTDYAQATQNLEAGAGGLMAARVDTPAQAEEFMQWVKFAPRGNRGMNGGGFDADFGRKSPAQFAVDSNRDTFVAIQVETTRILDHLSEVAAIDGVDVLFVGPTDLSQVLGIVGQFQHPKLWEALAAVAAACQKHGKHWATLGLTPEFADRAVELGCRMLSFGADASTLRRGVETLTGGFPKYFGAK